MGAFLGEFLVILFLVIINGVFALSELAIVSSRKARLQQMVEDEVAGAKVALELAESPNRFLSTVQIGITLIGILAGAFGGATLSQLIAEQIATIPALVDYSETIAVLLVVALTTYLSLVIGELVPKRLAMKNPERIAVLVARPMNWLSKVASPVVSLLSLSTDLLLKIMGVSDEGENTVTEQEILTMIEQGAEAGTFHKAESQLVEGVFRLDEIRVESLITPRHEIVWLDIHDTAEVIRAKITHEPYTNYPVGEGRIDNIVGVVQMKKLLPMILSNSPINLKSMLQKPLFIPESSSMTRLLEAFKVWGSHFALVVDEYGGIKGLITLGNVLEQVIVDIEDEEPEAVQRADGSWLLDGRLPIYRLKELFSDIELPEDERGLYSTLAGFVMLRLGRIPSVSENFEWNGLSFEIMDMDGHQIDKVLAKTISSV